MKLNIKVVTKGQISKAPGANICPWVMDVPPEAPSK